MGENMIHNIICLVIGYFCGCISSGYFVGRFYHIDIREHGSGNAGTTNVLRVLGKLPALITFVGDLAKAVQALFGDTGTRIIGTRHGEKLYETLMTNEECVRSQDMGNYYRVFADGRDLNYDKFFVDGKVQTMASEAYTSHNTKRLDVQGTIDKILTTDYVQQELEKLKNGDR